MLGPLLAMPSGQGLNMTLLAILKVNRANWLLVLEKNWSCGKMFLLLTRYHYWSDNITRILKSAKNHLGSANKQKQIWSYDGLRSLSLSLSPSLFPFLKNHLKAGKKPHDMSEHQFPSNVCSMAAKGSLSANFLRRICAKALKSNTWNPRSERRSQFPQYSSIENSFPPLPCPQHSNTELNMLGKIGPARCQLNLKEICISDCQWLNDTR